MTKISAVAVINRRITATAKFKYIDASGAALPVTLKNSDNTYEENIPTGTTKILDDTIVTQSDGIVVSVPYGEPVVCQSRANVAIINDDTEELIEEVPAGGQYRVLVFSGISGGNASTVHTNSIVSLP